MAGNKFLEVIPKEPSLAFSLFRIKKMGTSQIKGFIITSSTKGENLKNRMPLYIKPTGKLTPLDLMLAYRDHLEATDLDMAKDCGAGPFNMPYRWRPMTWKYHPQLLFFLKDLCSFDKSK